VTEREDKTAKIEDLEKPITDNDLEQVKGGAGDGSVMPSPILIKSINPRVIIPCV